MVMESADIVMIGAGLASTSLALALVNSGCRERIVILEASGSINTRKTWCFWDTGELPGYLRPLLCKRWDQWRISSSGEQHTAVSGDTPYCCIRAQDFYSYARERFAHGNVEIRFNTPATRVAAGLIHHPSRGVLVSSGGKLIRARYGVDSACYPGGDSAGQNVEGLLQCFSGAWIRAKQPIFNPDTVGLMEEMRVVEGHLQFIYRLPVSPWFSLIEVTRFGTVATKSYTLRRHLDTWLAKRLPGSGWTIESTEEGILPMQIHNVAADRVPWARAGIAGGHIRPATGYAFLPIQRWSRSAARALIVGRATLPPHSIPQRYKHLDRLLLKVLHNEMFMAPALFQRLARQCQAGQFARFMTEAATVRDLLAVINAMPKAVFIKALIKGLL